MDSKRVSAGIAALIASGSLAVDASVYDGKPMEKREERVASELVTVEQKGNVVEARAPWKGEQGLTIKYDLGETTVSERVKDKRKKEGYFQKKGDLFEYGILLNEVPDTNTFCYAVENAEQYDWFKQPPLNEEFPESKTCSPTECDTNNDGELDSFRPENVVNSYAVYHKELKDHRIGGINYETGKAFHRYRPQATDSDGNTIWGDSNYVNEQICDTFDTAWLDDATYPVKI